MPERCQLRWAEGVEFEGFPRKSLNLGWTGKERTKPPGDGLEERGGGVPPEIKEQA